MSKKNGKIYVFHIYRSDGTPLFLHPFMDTDILMNLSDSTVIEGRYGREPRVESLTIFRNRLYRQIETAVKEWVADVKFIPRFLVSAGVFLFIYLFTSLVIRDPLPVIDETVAASIGAVAAYLILSKRDQSSEKAASRRLKLRIQIDKIVFNESSLVKRFEDILHKNESEDVEGQIKALLSSGNNPFSGYEKDEVSALLSYLDEMFSGKVYRKHENRLERMLKNDFKNGNKQFAKWVKANGIDLPLYAAYRHMKFTSPPD